MLKSVRIENYRSVRDIQLNCDDLTILVGANGSGKSSILRAIALFEDKSPEVIAEDYYNGQTNEAIRITATFDNLSDAAKKEYGTYAIQDTFEMVRVFEWDDNKHKSKSTYYGKKMQNPDFKPIYGMNLTEARKNYNDLKKMPKYKDLPECSTLNCITTALEAFELQNPKMCEMIEDEGNIFKHSPDSFVRFVYVEPVRDAAKDAQEGKGSALADLMELAVKSSMAENDSIQKFAKKTQKEYDGLLCSVEQKELSDLGQSMTKTVNKFVPGAKVKLSWSATDLDTSLPPAKITLVEDKYRSEVRGAGHGLQRIFTMCILQHLSEAKAGEGGNTTSKSPALVLIIDEPELYQHPNRQRHISSVLHKLAKEGLPGALGGMQIIYSTHSPHFVGIDKLDHIRLVRKTSTRSDVPNAIHISSTNTKQIKDKLIRASSYDIKQSQNLERVLYTIMTPMINEGFFANFIVLVEGYKDQAALVAIAESMEYQLAELGISVIPCGGKNSLLKIALVFQQFDIPLYCMWDADYGNQGEDLNSALLYVAGRSSENQSSIAYESHACLDNKLEDVIKNCFGDRYQKYQRKCMTDLCLKEFEMSPNIISYMIKIARDDKIAFKIFEDIIQNVIKRCQN